MSCKDAWHEVLSYTLGHGSAEFIHQHVVDAYAVQHSSEHSTRIATAAGLIGLYLFVEKGANGREVQRMHMRLGNRMKEWPEFDPPEAFASVTVAEVLAIPPGHERDQMIRDWARAVWELWKKEHERVGAILREQMGEI
jgi:hypothetical protein